MKKDQEKTLTFYKKLFKIHKIFYILFILIFIINYIIINLFTNFMKNKIKEIIQKVKAFEQYFYQELPIKPKILPQKDFSITQAFRHMQRGLASSYRYMDFISLTQIPEKNAETLLHELKKVYIMFNDIKTNPNLDYCVVLAFDIQLWNRIQKNNLKVPDESCFGRPFKNNVKLLFIVKGREDKFRQMASSRLQQELKRLSVPYNITKGYTQGDNLVLAGRFNDGVQVAKDPYNFYLNALIGYEDIQHIGGSFVIAQKTKNNWGSLRQQNQSLTTIIGRKTNVSGYNSIFSQSMAPNSHGKRSRTKDQNGNPVIMARQSKLYKQMPIPRDITDPLQPQQGTYFLGFLNQIQKIERIVHSQQQPRKQEQQGFIGDHLISNLSASQGNILFVPSSANLKYHLNRNETHCDLEEISQLNRVDWVNDFPGMKQRSQSPYMFYSKSSYLQVMSTYKKSKNPQLPDLEPPTPRILRILAKTFNLWTDTWYNNRKQQQLKHLTHYLKLYHNDPIISRYSQEEYKDISIPIRNALAIYVELGHVFTSHSYGCRGLNSQGVFGAGYFTVESEDILVGGQTNTTFGQGKYLIHYLTKQQVQSNWLSGSTLSQDSGIGHVVPYYEQIIEKGLGALIQKYQKKFITLKEQNNDRKRIEFFESTWIALKGMQLYLKKYQLLVLEKLQKLKSSQTAEIQNLQQVALRLKHLQTEPPKTFQQGVQIVLTIYLCLHLTGEPVSIGRLDYILAKFVKDQKNLTLNQRIKYQQTIDHFFIKIGQKVLLNRAFFQDHQLWGNLAMGGSSSPYPQGASLNQWGMQMTVGGVDKNGKPIQNYVTLLALKSARRLPLNAPCLGLRVRKGTPQIYLQLAAKALKSGGAHPIILNDDKIIPGNISGGKINLNKQTWYQQKEVDVPYEKWNSEVSIQDARDFTSDGCYQILFAGRCWFALSGIVLLQPLEYVLNQGKSMIDAGYRFIHGKRNYFKFTPINEIKTFDEFKNIYLQTFKFLIARNWTGQLYSYGQVTDVCPATLLNGFLADTFEREADFYSNGTKYNLFHPQLSGFTNLINAMWNIKKLVFQTKQTTLQQIRYALLCNWGQDLIQPFIPYNSPQITQDRLKIRFESLRKRVWQLPKYGFDEQVSRQGNEFGYLISKTAMDAFSNPAIETVRMLKTLTKRFSEGQRKTFGIQLMLGCGTFQNYIDNGTGLAASFDGRKKAQTIAQDLSRQPSLFDQLLDPQNSIISETLRLYADLNLISGAVLDFNIDQNYDQDQLVQHLRQFSNGEGPSIITITTCDLDNIIECSVNSEKDLIRLRMGGWTQFAVAMFPDLLKQHMRRPRSVSKDFDLTKLKLIDIYAIAMAKKLGR